MILFKVIFTIFYVLFYWMFYLKIIAKILIPCVKLRSTVKRGGERYQDVAILPFIGK